MISHRALIIFDIDGTLFQTDRVTTPAVQRTFAAYGLPEPDAAVIGSFFGRPNEFYLDWLASLSPPGKAGEIIDAVNQLELKLIGEEGRLYPGAREALRDLRQWGCVLAICSNGPEDYVAEFLRAHDLARLFAMVRARGNVYDGKIAMVREILEHISTRPAAVVGDRQDDIEAAHAHGAYAIAAAYGFGSAPERIDADRCVASAHEIFAAVQKLIEESATRPPRRPSPRPGGDRPA